MKFFPGWSTILQMENLKFAGIGHILAFIIIPVSIGAIVITLINPHTFDIPIPRIIGLCIGTFLTIVWINFYSYTMRYIFKQIRNHKLATTGPYALCQHPLYASFIFFLIPGAAFLFNSWFLFVPAVIMLILFKVLINIEYKMLEEEYGEEWKEYHRNTPEILPIGIKRMIKRT